MVVNPNCTTTSDHWVIYPTIQIEDININTTTTSYDFELQELHSEFQEEELKTIHSLIGAIGKPVPLAQMTQLLEFRKEIAAENTQFKLAHFLLSGGSTITTMALMMGCVIAGFFAIRFCRRHHHRRLDDHHYETVPMAARVPPAPPAPIIIQAPTQPVPSASAQPTAPDQVVRGAVADTQSPPPSLFTFLAPKGSGSLSC